MARKNIPPPPPPRGSSSSGGGTATAAPSTSATPYYSLSEIDDDDSAAAGGGVGGGAPLPEDDATEISDVDSILEMAKRLDAASVISDPSFIEGPAHHHQHPSRGAYRMDEIASESDEEESSNSSSEDDSSSDDSDSSSSSSGEEDGRENHHRRHHRGRYDYKHGGSKGSRSTHSDRRRHNQRKHTSSDNEGMMRSHRGSGSGGGRSDRRRRNHRQQQQQQHSPSMPSQPYYDNSYDSRGQQQQQQHNMMSYQGGGERKYSPPRGVGATAIDPMMMYTTTINNNNNNIPKKQSRGSREDPNQRFSSTTTTKNSAAASSYENQTAYEKRQKQERYYDREEATESVKRRRTKMIVIPLVVIVIIGVVIAVAVAVGGKGGGGESGNTKDLQENNDNINAFQPIPVPTTSPTYFGLYQCPYGKSGLTATKGCLGFIECSAIGTAVGEIQYCSSGTLYDVKSGVCDFAENVSCSTNLPTQEEIAASQQGASPTTPVNTPPTTDVVGVVPPPQNSPSITVGPMITSDHKLLFEGVTNPGQMNNNAMNTIAKNLEAYLNIFYSARVIDAYNDDDYILESISNVTIGVVAKNFVFVQSNRRNLRHLQTVAIKANGLTMTYQQTTKYDTIDSSITVGTIVRHPYQERYQERIVSYLKAVDPETFSTLTRALFVEGPAPQPQPSPVPVTNPPPPTRKPTSAPTKQSNNPPPAVLQTNPPSKAPVTPPPAAATVPGTSGSYTIQGFIFFDENMNGKFDYDIEKPFQGVWVNLKLCTPKENGNDWVNTGASEAQGMYKFENVEEGEYFIEFFKPSPGDNYNFTLPQVAGTDGSVLDSDVIGMTPHGGKTACFTVGPGFDSNKYFNAGYKLKPTAAPTVAPSNSPTQSPIDISYYCADVTTTSAGNQNFNFLGCQIRCGNGFSECPGNTRCVFADMCIEPV
jgi:hypothetical protein